MLSDCSVANEPTRVSEVVPQIRWPIDHWRQRFGRRKRKPRGRHGNQAFAFHDRVRKVSRADHDRQDPIIGHLDTRSRYSRAEMIPLDTSGVVGVLCQLMTCVPSIKTARTSWSPPSM